MRKPRSTGAASRCFVSGFLRKPPAIFATSAAKSSDFFATPSPRSKRTKRRSVTIPPAVFATSARSLSIVLPGVTTDSWSTRQTSVNHFAFLPSMIFGQAASGLPSSLSWPWKISACFATASAGTWLFSTYWGLIAAICIATFSAKSFTLACCATAGVSVPTSRRTPILPPRWTYEVTSPAPWRSKRSQRRTWMFSPIVPESAWRKPSTVLSLPG